MNGKKFACSDNHGQNIRKSKIEIPSKIELHRKRLICTFMSFLTAITKV